MKRCIVGICILLSLVVLCGGSLFVLRRQTAAFSAETQRLAALAGAHETESALDAHARLMEDWEKFHDAAGVFVEGEKLDTIRKLLAGLRPMLEASHPDTLPELARIRALTEDVFREELPILWHIL